MKNVFNPLVSIIIPVYNGANYLNDAIDSALAQTYSNIEIIVINDGSDDGGATHEVACSYGDKIRYFAKPNGGVSSALNFGISKMNGTYFSWLSHDDLYEPEKIQIEVTTLSEQQSMNTIICSDNDEIDKFGNKIKIPKKKFDFSKRVDAKHMLIELFKGQNLNGCALLIPKAVFELVGDFNEDYHYMQDLDMWLRICLVNFDFYCLPNKLVKMRIHDQQMTVKIKNSFFKEQSKSFKLLGNSLIDSPLVNDIAIVTNYFKYLLKNNQRELAHEMMTMFDDKKKISLPVTIRLFFYRAYASSYYILKSSYRRVKSNFYRH